MRENRSYSIALLCMWQCAGYSFHNAMTPTDVFKDPIDMRDSPSPLSLQERDLQLFLDSLGITLPPVDIAIFDEYIVIRLNTFAASLFDANDDMATLLAYRINGFVFPILIVFLRGNEEIQFCHSTLLLDSYVQGELTAPLLRKVTDDFFSQSFERMLETLNPSWTNTCLFGHLNCPIYWDTEPEMKIVTDLFVETLGQICKIPLFPSVFYYNNLYDQNLLEAVLSELKECRDILVLGSGAGLEAVCVALKYGVHVDATDINPVAIANTVAACRRTGTDHLVHAWVSDGWSEVKGTYDAILFEAPLATNEMQLHDPNRYDSGGRLLREVLLALPSHLKTGGRMYLMSRPDLTPYLPSGLRWKVLRFFAAENNLAIHEIRVEQSFLL
ncbi:MAG: methyltransferase [Pseudomonadota bacterium]